MFLVQLPGTLSRVAILMPWLIALALFVVGAVTDVAWSKWTLTVNRKQPWQAAAWGFALCIPYALTVNAYVRQWAFVLPYAAGAALGTFVTTRRG